MTRVYKPADAAEQAAFVKSHCRLCRLEAGCTVLAEARPLDTDDSAYPSELVFDDLGRPSCTDFQGPDGAMVDGDRFGAAPAAPSRPAEPEVASIALTTVGRGVVDAIRLRPGRRSWTVPYASVRELFADRETGDLRDTLGVPEPDKARVHRGRVGVTITARSTRDRCSVSSSVRLKLAGAAR